MRPSPPPVRAPRAVPPPPYVLPARRRPELPEVDPWDGRERLHPADDALEPLTLSSPLWQKILRAAVLARSVRLPPAPGSDGKSLRRIGGCLVRLVILAVALIVALASALYVFGRSLM
jgi:hypothetical protein